MTSRPALSPSIVDHNLHGLLTIRLTAAPPDGLQRLERTLGPSRGKAAAEPDISVTFTETLPGGSRLRLLGLNEAAFDDEHFYLVDGAGHRTRIDFRGLDGRCELVCERGVEAVPLLVPLVGLRLLAKQHVLLHAAAFTYGGEGTLVAGWQKGGKTEMLLAYMAAGGEFLGDEWVVVPADGRSMYGLGGVVQVWGWHLRYLPQYRSRLYARERARLTVVRGYQRLYGRLPRRPPHRGVAGQLLHRLSLDGGNSVVGQVRATPERLFGERVADDPAPLDRLFLATSGARETTVRRITGAEIAERMTASLDYERRRLLAAYAQYRFAFPRRRSVLIESAPERERTLLTQAFASKPAYEVSHPYPVPLQELHQVTASL